MTQLHQEVAEFAAGLQKLQDAGWITTKKTLGSWSIRLTKQGQAGMVLAAALFPRTTVKLTSDPAIVDPPWRLG